MRGDEVGIWGKHAEIGKHKRPFQRVGAFPPPTPPKGLGCDGVIHANATSSPPRVHSPIATGTGTVRYGTVRKRWRPEKRGE